MHEVNKETAGDGSDTCANTTGVATQENAQANTWAIDIHKDDEELVEFGSNRASGQTSLPTQHVVAYRIWLQPCQWSNIFADTTRGGIKYAIHANPDAEFWIMGGKGSIYWSLLWIYEPTQSLFEQRGLNEIDIHADTTCASPDWKLLELSGKNSSEGAFC